MRESRCIVLASGGIDSAVLLSMARERGTHVTALFVDYGQAAARAEEQALVRLAAHYQVESKILRISGSTFGDGEIKGRNAFLAHCALLGIGEATEVMIGIHAGTTYRDCSPEFVSLMQESFDFHMNGLVVLTAPFVHFSKLEVFELATSEQVPIDITYSCEAGNVPCGKCLSCQDRAALPIRN